MLQLITAAVVVVMTAKALSDMVVNSDKGAAKTTALLLFLLGGSAITSTALINRDECRDAMDARVCSTAKADAPPVSNSP